MIADEPPRETETSADVLRWRPPRAVCFVVNGGRAGGGVLVAPDLVLTAYHTVADLIDDQTTATTHCFFGSLVGAKGYERTRDREVATIVAFEKQMRISRNAPTPTTDGCALLRLRENEEAASDAVSPAPISPHSPRPQVGEVVFVATRYDKWSPMRVAEIAEGGFALERAPNDPIALDGDGGVCFTRDGAVIGLVAEYDTPLPKESVYVVAADALYEALVDKAPEVRALLERVSTDAPPEQSTPEPEPARPPESVFTRLRHATLPPLRKAFVVAGIALSAAFPYLAGLLIRDGARVQSDWDNLLTPGDGAPPDTVTTLVWNEDSNLRVGTRKGSAYRFDWEEFQEIPEAESPRLHRPVRDIVSDNRSSDFVRRGADLTAGIGEGVSVRIDEVLSEYAQKDGQSSSASKEKAQRGVSEYELRVEYGAVKSTTIHLPAEMGKPVDIVAGSDPIFIIGLNGVIQEIRLAETDRNFNDAQSIVTEDAQPDRGAIHTIKTLHLNSPVVATARIPGLVAFASSQGRFLLETGTTLQPPDLPVQSFGVIAQIALARSSKDVLLLALTRHGELFLYRADSSKADWTRLSIPRLARAAKGVNLPGAPGSLTSATLDREGRDIAVADERGVIYLIALDEEVGNPDKFPRLVAVIRGHAGPVTQLAISPNRQWLASASLDGRLRVTHLPTAIREANWPLHDLLAPPPPPPLMPRPLDAPASVARNPAEQIDDTRDRIIVFGADKDLAAARAEIERARAAGFVDVEILLRQNWYRSVAHFPSDEARDAALPKLRALSPNAADAYARRVSDWCDAIEPTGAPDMIRCRLISDGNGGLSDDLLKNNAFRNVQEPLNAKSGADLQPVQSPPPAQQFPNQMRKRLK